MKSPLKTERLLIRQWEDRDRAPFAQLNASSLVMKYFPRSYTPKESDQFIEKTIININSNGYGFFAVEIIESGEFIGFVGINNPNYKTPFTPCTEIGWRLHSNFWNKGYATEAALKVLNFSFEELKLKEIVSFTSKNNHPSIKVMERIGMSRDLQGDFDHPGVEEGHELKRHVLYRKSRNKE